MIATSILLRAASLLAPRHRREEWLREWRSELWYVPRDEALRFTLGAFRDALWVRRSRGGEQQTPWQCLAMLTAIAAASLLLAVRLPGPRLAPLPRYLRASDLPAGCVVMLAFTCLMLPAIRIAMGPNRHAMPRAGRLRRSLFLAAKIALLHPVMLCGFLVMNLISPVIPVANVAIMASWIWAFRWVLTDQRRRCPVCLQHLTEPVRIGTPSHTLLEWYGAESACSSGHGLLHSTETSSTWLRLDDSWRGLFE
jgi:hypothetical protein